MSTSLGQDAAPTPTTAPERATEEQEYDALTRRKRDSAAILIQKNYRGYRTRRHLEGLTFDASDRWLEVNSPPRCLRSYARFMGMMLIDFGVY